MACMIPGYIYIYKYVTSPKPGIVKLQVLWNYFHKVRLERTLSSRLFGHHPSATVKLGMPHNPCAGRWKLIRLLFQLIFHLRSFFSSSWNSELLSVPTLLNYIKFENKNPRKCWLLRHVPFAFLLSSLTSTKLTISICCVNLHHEKLPSKLYTIPSAAE